MNPAEEMRAAAQVLRCDHRFPVQPPEGTFFRPGQCRLCGTPYSEDRIPDAVAEPLAAWLEHDADLHKDIVRWECVYIPGLAVARAIRPPAEADQGGTP